MKTLLLYYPRRANFRKKIQMVRVSRNGLILFKFSKWSFLLHNFFGGRGTNKFASIQIVIDFESTG